MRNIHVPVSNFFTWSWPSRLPHFLLPPPTHFTPLFHYVKYIITCMCLYPRYSILFPVILNLPLEPHFLLSSPNPLSPLPSPCSAHLAPSHHAEWQAKRHNSPQQSHSVWAGWWSTWWDLTWDSREKKIQNLQRKIQSDSSHNCGWRAIHSWSFLPWWQELVDWRD